MIRMKFLRIRPATLRNDLVTVGKLNSELRIGQGLFDFSFNLDGFLFGHG